jgi:hypothetical protein
MNKEEMSKKIRAKALSHARSTGRYSDAEDFASYCVLSFLERWGKQGVVDINLFNFKWLMANYLRQTNGDIRSKYGQKKAQTWSNTYDFLPEQDIVADFDQEDLDLQDRLEEVRGLGYLFEDDVEHMIYLFKFHHHLSNVDISKAVMLTPAGVHYVIKKIKYKLIQYFDNKQLRDQNEMNEKTREFLIDWIKI